jgi:hypothetical protein
MEVEKTGFKLVRLTGITVNVQDNLEQNFKLALGSASETITVEAGAVNVNTTDATVSTLIDNRFVENMPLNGRSFSSLLDLTPGVVLNATNFYDQGQFSVNGQRPDANYFTVDGVSANLGTSASSLGQGGGGQLPATSSFWGHEQPRVARCPTGVPSPNLNVRTGVWAHARRTGFRRDEIRHQRFPRYRVRIFPQ